MTEMPLDNLQTEQEIHAACDSGGKARSRPGRLCHRCRHQAAHWKSGSGDRIGWQPGKNFGEIAEHRPADGTKIDPHTPVFDQNGILWFTNEETNYTGGSIRKPVT